MNKIMNKSCELMLWTKHICYLAFVTFIVPLKDIKAAQKLAITGESLQHADSSDDKSRKAWNLN